MLYLPALFSDFIYDDYHMIVNNNLVQNFSLINIKKFFLGKITSENIPLGMYRPLLMIGYSLQNIIARGKPFFFHLSSIILHTICTIFFFLILQEIFKIKKYQALVFSLIFALHPINTQAINSISYQAELFFSIFLLISFLSYAKNKKISSFLFFIFALTFKETAVIYLPLIIAYDLLLKREKKIKFYFFCAIFLIAYLLLRQVLFGAYITAYRHRPLIKDIALSLISILFYTALWFLPFRLSLLHLIKGFPLYSLFGIGIIIVILFFLYLKKEDTKILLFGIFWFYLPLLLQFFGSFTVPLSEHRLYFSSIGMTIFLIPILNSIRLTKLYILLIILGAMTFTRNITWSSSIYIWKDVLKKYPQAVIAYKNLGQELLEKGKYEEAIKYLKIAIKADPFDYKVFYNLGIAYGYLGNFPAAIKCFQSAIKLNPYYASAYNNLGVSYLGLKEPQIEKAAQALKKALELGYAVNPIILKKAGLKK